MRARHAAAVVSALLYASGAAGCTSPAPSEPSAPTINLPPAEPAAPAQPRVGEPQPEPVSPEPAPPLSSAEPAPELPPPGALRGGICASFEPIKSKDACRADSDCAPSALCHAPTCIAAAKAPKRTPGVMCTMSLECRSTDVGKCACVDKVCSLVPR